ncbi:MAG TPA: succinate dehydrogenase assembly factor 2 [Casimicrobiaceae bacterium]|nr:succinate dehydrogenase assembly factor 2 [Casimicrobiaceae bacterium]
MQLPAQTPTSSTDAIAPVRLRRLRWRARRGMLENDLVLEQFFAARATPFDENDVAMLDRLLALPDNTLWELFTGLAEPEDAYVAPLLREIRAAATAHSPLYCRKDVDR